MPLGIGWPNKLIKRINMLFVSGLAEGKVLPVYHDFLQKLNNELSRVRRFERPLSISVLKPNGNGAPAEKTSINRQKTGPQQAIYAQCNDIKPISQSELILCGQIIKNSIREIDMATYDIKNHQFILFFPETNKTKAHHVINRIKKLIGNSMAGHLSFGIAEFPENGLIIEDLIEHAVLGINSQAENAHLRADSSTQL